jgi:predicted lipoprotein with Yx(FWY)xxD motif
MLGARNRWSTAGRLAGAALAVGLLAAACSSGSTSSTSTTSAAASSVAPASSAGSAAAGKVSSAASAVSSKASSAGSAVSSAAAPAATGPATVGTTTGALGTFLVDGKGMTLYMYVPDTAGESTCYDACAVAWPPLLTKGAPTASGSADKSQLSTTARKDGSTMVKYGVWPLYYFAKDTKPGDTTGQGVKNVWYVVGVDGQPIKTPAS